MRKHRILRLLLAWLVAAGLVAAPMTAPAVARAADQTAAVMSSTMADMPCCPDGASKQLPQPDQCKDCATMILCTPQPLPAVLPVAASTSAISAVLAELTAGAHPHLEEIGSSPPAPPPRS